MKPSYIFGLFILIMLNSCSNGPDMSFVEEVEIKKKFTGVKKDYYESGVLKSVIRMKRDKRDSLCVDYYEDGTVHLEVFYKDGKRDGIYRWYYPDGKLYQERNYKNNELHGEFKEFKKSGDIKFTKEYFFGSEL
jgi:antitoxin component YwqK of YwqJK toxin-antitoxin module